MNHRRTVVLLVSLAATGSLAGCGAKPDAADAGQAAAKVSFQRRAEALCKPTRSVTAADTPAVIRRDAKALRVTHARRLDGLRRLGAPAKDRRQLAAYFQATEDLVRFLPVLEAATRKGDRQAIRQSTTRAAMLQRRAATAARRYGVSSCS